MRGKMDVHGQTDIGRKRPVNEDQFMIADLNKAMTIQQSSLSHDYHERLFSGSQGMVLLVADGMGGAAAGEVASALAIETAIRYLLNTMPWFFRLENGEGDDQRDELKAALEACQQSIEVAATAPGRQRMGTTLTMAYLLWPRLFVVHAGDSRCYLLREGKLEQITLDHTVAQRLVDQGTLTPEEAERSRWSHVLYNCIGGGMRDLNPDVYSAKLSPGDTLLLCSDGLSKVVSADLLREELARRDSAEQICQRLVALANDFGGPDNITVVVARFLADGQAESRTEEQAAASIDDTSEFLRLISDE